ncbi:MAG: S-methyl-5'-thioadenosine phosphorylase [Lentisphaerota bacterium]
MTTIGIIGGSGLDNPSILKNGHKVTVTTPCGDTTSPLTVGQIAGINTVLIARHGNQHIYPPTQVNFRANIHALKEQGCTHIISTAACGSLRDEIKRGDLVILDQFIDFTRRRHLTFFDAFKPGAENAVHTAMPDPFDESMRQKLIANCRKLQYKHHERGTVITIEGPRFSTRAESNMYRIWGADVVNMTVANEAILANEAHIPYATVAISTDYDSWKVDEAPCAWPEILRIFQENVERVTRLILETIPLIAAG